MIKHYKFEALVYLCSITLTEYLCVLGTVLDAGDTNVNRYSIPWSTGKTEVYTQIATIQCMKQQSCALKAEECTPLA